MNRAIIIFLGLSLSAPSFASLISLDFKWVSFDSGRPSNWIPGPNLHMNLIIEDSVSSSRVSADGDLTFESVIRGGTIGTDNSLFFFDATKPNSLTYERNWSTGWDRLLIQTFTRDSLGNTSTFGLQVEGKQAAGAAPTDLKLLNSFPMGMGDVYGNFEGAWFTASAMTISVVNVPESSSLALFIFGALLIVGVRKAHKNRQQYPLAT